jgi:hypothetical protein
MAKTQTRQQRVGEVFAPHQNWEHWDESVCPSCGKKVTNSKWSITFLYDTLEFIDWKVRMSNDYAEVPICDRCEDYFDPNVLLEH